MLRSSLTLLALCLTAAATLAQVSPAADANRRSKEKQSVEAAPALSFGYFAQQLTHPGASIGYEYALRTTAITIEKHRKGKTVLKQNAFALRPQLGVWIQPGNSVGLLPTVDLEYRRTRRAWTWSAGLSAGYVQTFRTGTTYVATDDPRVFEERHLTGESSPQAGLVLGFGQDRRFAGRGDLNWAFRLRPAYQFQSNAAGRWRAFAEASVSLQIGRAHV